MDDLLSKDGDEVKSISDTTNTIKKDKKNEILQELYLPKYKDGIDFLFEHDSRLVETIYELIDSYGGISIEIGRNIQRDFGLVYNIIVSYKGEKITSQDGVSGLGEVNIVVNNGIIIIGMIRLPEKFQGKGLAKYLYQSISDRFQLPILNSKERGFNQTISGGYIWKNRNSFQPDTNILYKAKKIYSEYLDTIFPDRQIRKIGSSKDVLYDYGFDSVEIENNNNGTKKEINIFDPKQIYILGSNKDIEQFKQWFVKNKQSPK